MNFKIVSTKDFFLPILFILFLFFSGCFGREYIFINRLTETNTESEWIPASGLKAPQVAPASFVDAGISGAWEFEDGKTETVVGNFKMPDYIDLSKNFYLCLGWSSPTSEGFADWNIALLLTDVNGNTFSNTPTVTFRQLKQSSATPNGLTVSRFTVPNTDFNANTVCGHIRIERIGGSAIDTLNAAAYLHGLAIIYEEKK